MTFYSIINLHFWSFELPNETFGSLKISEKEEKNEHHCKTNKNLCFTQNLKKKIGLIYSSKTKLLINNYAVWNGGEYRDFQ